MAKCKYCQDLENLCWECPDDPHHGQDADCEECGANYYDDYSTIWATNTQAIKNHPELATFTSSTKNEDYYEKKLKEHTNVHIRRFYKDKLKALKTKKK